MLLHDHTLIKNDPNIENRVTHGNLSVTNGEVT